MLKKQKLIVTINELEKLVEELRDTFDDGQPITFSEDDKEFDIDIIKEKSLEDSWRIHGS